MRHARIFIHFLWIFGVYPAYCAPTLYTIHFTSTFTSGPTVPSGAFLYDPAVTNSFSTFLVLFNGITFDLTGVANASSITDFGLGPTPACLGNQQGAVASFRLLTACGAGVWNGGEATIIGPSTFSISLPGPGFPWLFLGGQSSSGGTACCGASGTYQVQSSAQGPVYISDSQNNRIRAITPYDIVTAFAGNGTQGFAGDTGPATGAELHTPFGVTFDYLGNIYIADTANNRIRKVDLSGNITTVAGNGAAAYSGDGGPATGAALNSPTGVAADNSGNLYIADERNNRIRKVSDTGTITTVAGNGAVGNAGDGGPATSAQLYYPAGIAVDGAGNLYIADTDNNRIRKVNTSGTITTIAGNGAPGYNCNNGTATSVGLHNPYGVAVDGSGNVFIADYANQCIREVTPSGAITTVAGNGIPSYGGDGGPATSAELNYPTGIAVDSVGDLFIADYVNNRIRKVDAFGIITTIAGTGAAGYGGDGGLDTGGELYQPTGVAVVSGYLP